eukprot:scaffold107999_cov45-Phaeocystis_antarctica.AAC.1
MDVTLVIQALNSRPSAPRSRRSPTATLGQRNWQRAVGGRHQPLHVVARLAMVGRRRLTWLGLGLGLG